MLKLIFQGIDKRRIQSVSIILSVMISTAVIFALIQAYEGVSQGIEKSSMRMGADLIVVPKEAETVSDDEELLFTGMPVTVYMNKKAEEEISGIKGVEKTTAQFYGQTLNSACCSTGREQRIIGYDAQSDWVISPWADKDISQIENNEVVIGCDVGGFESGSGIILGCTMQAAAVLEQTGTSLDSSIFVDMDTARELSAQIEGYEHFWDKYGEPETLISAVLVKTQEGKKTSVKNLIEMNGEYKCIVSGDVIEEIHSQMKIVFTIMFYACLLMCIAAVFQIFARFYSMAWDRKSELGLYMALGAARKDLKKIIYGEVGILVGIGTILGIGMGELLYRLLISFMMQESTFPFAEPGAGCITAAIGIIAVLAAGISYAAVLVPMRQISKIQPVLAMHKADID